MYNIFFRYQRDMKEAFFETLRYSILTAALLLLVKMVPILALISFFLPSIFAVVTFRNGMVFSFLSALIIALISSTFLEPMMVVYSLFTIAGVGLAVGEFAYRKRTPALAIFAGAFMVILNILLLMYFEARMMNTNLVDYIINGYRESFQMQKEMFNIDMDVDTFILNLRRTFPGMVVCMGFTISAVNYFFTGAFLTKITKKRQIATLGEFSLPGNVFGGILIVYLMTLFLIYSEYIYKDTLIINLTIIFGMLFFLQGLASIYNFISKRVTPVFRNIITLTLCMFMPLYAFVVAIGFIDAVVNLRRIQK
ncbi:MAG: DUF2232 domain-containing protein [Proteocatella sp.]